MGWKATGAPTVRRQRDRWGVRVDGIDTETGKHRPRQLGTYASQRAALAAAIADAAGAGGRTRDSGVVVAPVVGLSYRRKPQGARAVRVGDRPRRDGVGSGPARPAGPRRHRSVARGDRGGWPTVSAEHRDLPHSPQGSAHRRGRRRSAPAQPGGACTMPRQVTKSPKVKATDAWSEAQVDRFLEMCADHRWAVGFRLAVLYGLRRSEVLALRWDDVDWEARTIRIDEGLVPLDGGVDWTPGKTARSRRVIGLDPVTLRLVASRRRQQQAEERLLVGDGWADHDLLLTTRTGSPVLPRSFDRVARAHRREGQPPEAHLPRATPHRRHPHGAQRNRRW